jgi:hypothetical protein
VSAAGGEGSQTEETIAFALMTAGPGGPANMEFDSSALDMIVSEFNDLMAK